MAFSKKGLRGIIVEKQKFYWKFNEKIIIISDQKHLLIVDFGWFDKWLFVNSKNNKPPEFEPKSVTPEFIKKSILFAINKGWEKGKMEIEYRKGIFNIKK